MADDRLWWSVEPCLRRLLPVVVTDNVLSLVLVGNSCLIGVDGKC